MNEVNNPILGYADSYRLMVRMAEEDGKPAIVSLWSVITDLERNMAPLMSAALAREAALREELAAVTQDRDYCKRVATHNKELGEQTQQRLTAAEQRNAELQVFDNLVGYLLDYCEGETIYEESLQRWLAESIERTKPTESGASE
jgi:hypothetical protein